ncbi:MAG: hypothetical protein ACP5I4_14125, partial [Oceanipulchritudo sp.]
WFIAIMATGAVANILQILDAGRGGIHHQAAVVLLGIAVLAFGPVLALILTRFVNDRRTLYRELAHSSLIQFYSAMFIAAAICTTGLIKIPLPWVSEALVQRLAEALWTFAVVTGAAKAVFTPWRIITLDHAEPKRVLGFWFLPPVGLFVIVFAGNFLVLSPGYESWLPAVFAINLVLLGAALFQTMVLFTMFLFRALTYPFPGADVLPSFAIGLAPVGVSIIALLSFLPVIGAAAPAGFADVAALKPLLHFGLVLFWGFGLWWLAVAAVVIATGFRTRKVPVTLGFWAFIFPPAAFALASLLLGQSTGIAFIRNTGVYLGYTVLAGWLLIAVLTVRGALDRSIFRLPPSFAEILSPEDRSKIL